MDNYRPIALACILSKVLEKNYEHSWKCFLLILNLTLKENIDTCTCDLKPRFCGVSTTGGTQAPSSGMYRNVRTIFRMKKNYTEIYIVQYTST